MKLGLFKNSKLTLVAILALSFALYSVFSRKSTPPAAPIASPPTASYTHSIAGIGIVEPENEVISIGTELNGVVRKVCVKEGASVKEGDPLFVLDQRDIDAQIETYRAARDAAIAQKEEALSQFETVQNLLESQAVSKDEYNRRKYTLQNAKATLKQRIAQLNQTLTTKERLVIRAPRSGEILSVDIRPGESTIGITTPLIRMGETKKLHLRVEIDEQYASLLSKKSPATASPRGLNTQKVALKWIRIEPYIKPKTNLAVGGQKVDTRIIEVIYEIEPGTTPLYVGQQMDISIERPKQ